MAKTRMIKTDQRRSRKVASWPIEVRYFWVLLWGYADDHGKGVDDPLLIKADCFPLDRDITDEHIEAWMQLLAKSGVISRYDVDGHPFFAIINWKEHQKPPHPTADVLPGPEHPGACARAVHEERVVTGENAPTGLGLTLGLGSGLSRVGNEARLGGGAPAGEKPPPLFCPSHPNGTTGKCGPCGDARRRYDGWLREQKTPLIPAPPVVIHLPGLCDAHRQRAAECEMCEREGIGMWSA